LGGGREEGNQREKDNKMGCDLDEKVRPLEKESILSPRVVFYVSHPWPKLGKTRGLPRNTSDQERKITT